MKKQILSITVNGEDYELAVAPNTTLLELLRDECGFTGVKEGCSEGVCGACTVLMNGEPIRSCTTLALEAEGSEILTIGSCHSRKAPSDPTSVCGKRICAVRVLHSRHDSIVEGTTR